ncbi:hypothetical protein HK104_007063 [Borealophlyctis nickersoniae]|nr:hypothetical protein HK104_007063 [Borealophlyctis nickersoniae]
MLKIGSSLLMKTPAGQKVQQQATNQVSDWLGAKKNKGDKGGPSQLVGVDTEPIQKTFREHVLANISVNLTTLYGNNWISAQTFDVLVNTLKLQGLTVNPNTVPVAVENAMRHSGVIESPTNPLSPPLTPPYPKAGPPTRSAPTVPRSAAGPASIPGTVGHSATVNSFNRSGPPAYTPGPPPIKRKPSGGPFAAANAAVGSAAAAVPPPLPPREPAASAPTPMQVDPPRYEAARPVTLKPPTGRRTVIAVSDFDAVEEEDLAFRTGDIITVLEDVDENWYKGELRGRKGIFPKSYVQSR